eukprot:gene56236-59516_t
MPLPKRWRDAVAAHDGGGAPSPPRHTLFLRLCMEEEDVRLF